jgi:HTH-type transcriptional regulator, transcriptional repressor of NAD biosynthesis genes
MTDNSRFRLGLVVGKFSPLHQGHIALINHAAQHCDRLLILSYSNPEFHDCEANLRRRWFAQLYPQHECVVIDKDWLESTCFTRKVAYQALPPNDADDSTQQHYLAYLLKDVLLSCPDAMFASETYLVPCAEVLSIALGSKVSPVMVDLNRELVPVSGTFLRGDKARYWSFLPPVVRADWVRRIVLLGGESSGKTTLAQELAKALHTEWVPEYGRELWDRQHGQLSRNDLVTIAHEQCTREDAMAQRCGPWLVCDTSPLTTLGYFLWMFGENNAQIAKLAERSYALTILCIGDFDFVQDGTRRDAEFQNRQHRWYLQQLADSQIVPLETKGSLVTRLSHVLSAISSIDKGAVTAKNLL